MSKEMIKFAIEMSPELAAKFEEMSLLEHASKSDIFLKALFLMHVAIKSKQQGHALGVVDKLGKKVGDIVV